jgi:hypothetical protein
MPSLAMALSAVLDMVNPEFPNHHQRVAYIAYQLRLPFPQRKAGLLSA